jgi:hypothetical protein
LWLPQPIVTQIIVCSPYIVYAAFFQRRLRDQADANFKLYRRRRENKSAIPAVPPPFLENSSRSVPRIRLDYQNSRSRRRPYFSFFLTNLLKSPPFSFLVPIRRALKT